MGKKLTIWAWTSWLKTKALAHKDEALARNVNAGIVNNSNCKMFF
jgi:hypothetical protein